MEETKNNTRQSGSTTKNTEDLLLMPENPEDAFFCLPIIGQIEGHYALDSNQKSTKYDHVLPLLASLEQSNRVKGILILINTLGGDVEAGLAMAEVIASMEKPTVSIVLGGGHSIGVPLAVSADRSFIVPSATMTIHPVRTQGLVLGVPEAFDYLKKMQDRIIRFIVHHSNVKEEYFREREEIIRSYKEQGRRKEIQGALKALERAFTAKEPTLPRDLCYLYGSFMEDYLHDVDICRRFAQRSRERMAQIILEHCGWSALEEFCTIHNYIDVEERMLRKGAVSAKRGEKLLIPINMRDGSLICIGKGNPDWNCSAPHGAGRLMSRSAAFERLTMAEYEAQMSGIYSTCVTPDTLDESPMAYKSMEQIVENIGPTAEIVCRIKPIYNFKAAE